MHVTIQFVPFCFGLLWHWLNCPDKGAPLLHKLGTSEVDETICPDAIHILGGFKPWPPRGTPKRQIDRNVVDSTLVWEEDISPACMVWCYSETQTFASIPWPIDPFTDEWWEWFVYLSMWLQREGGLPATDILQHPSNHCFSVVRRTWLEKVLVIINAV